LVLEGGSQNQTRSIYSRSFRTALGPAKAPKFGKRLDWTDLCVDMSTSSIKVFAGKYLSCCQPCLLISSGNSHPDLARRVADRFLLRSPLFV
jgi:hypothetical protein